MTSTHANDGTEGQRERELSALARAQAWSRRTHGRGLPGLAPLMVAQFILLLVLLQAYSWFRKTYFQRPEDVAFDNALDIIALQRHLGIAVTDVEIPLQRWVLERPELVDVFNAYYRQFKPALYVCAGLCLLLAPGAYRRVRRVFVIVTLIALPMYALYPLAPPRFMEPYGYSFVDTLAVFGGAPSSSAGAGGANQFAAMPSMHIGWTTVAAMWLAAAIPWYRVGAVLGAIHLAVMCVTVVVTGNHYVLDIVGGFLVVAGALAVAHLLPDSRSWWPWRRAVVRSRTQRYADGPS